MDRHGEKHRVDGLVGEHFAHVDEFLCLFAGRQLPQQGLGALAGLLLDVAQSGHAGFRNLHQVPQERRAARSEPYDADIDLVVGAHHAAGGNRQRRALKERASRDIGHSNLLLSFA